VKRTNSYIVSLLDWIDDNLNQDLSLDDVVKKSGYTKWHLQKIFKLNTGYTISAYIKRRRLCKAALDLKLGTKDIAAIANLYKFGSQQSFTSEFTRHFGTPPAKYRKTSGLGKVNFIGRHLSKGHELKERGTYVSFDHKPLYCVSKKYLCPINEINMPHRIYRQSFRHNFIQDNDIGATPIFSLCDFTPHDEDNFLCEYHIGVDNESIAVNYTSIHVITGDYLRFDYCGNEEDFYDFVMAVYFNVFDNLKITRRKGVDIEEFVYNKDGEVSYRYYIPITFDIDLMFAYTHSHDKQHSDNADD